MKVVLTGEGADELFAGYGIFKEDRIRRFWARDPGSTVRPRLLSTLHGEIGRDEARRSGLWQQFFARGLGDVDHPTYSHLPRWANGAWAARAIARELEPARHVEELDAAGVPGLPSGWRSWSPLARAQWVEMATFMTPYLLASQGDRVALAHGVEVRYPYLDTAVAEWAFRLPDRLKLAGLRDKVVLRHLAARLLPAEFSMRPKVPFRAPTTTALFDGPRLPDYAEALLAPGAIERLGLVDPRAARVLTARFRRPDAGAAGEREQMALIGILTLQVLGHHFTEGFSRQVSDALARLGGRAPQVLEDHSGVSPAAGGVD
jgi:asparagine synthase (glutamine-hydrolysing)